MESINEHPHASAGGSSAATGAASGGGIHGSSANGGGGSGGGNGVTSTAFNNQALVYFGDASSGQLNVLAQRKFTSSNAQAAQTRIINNVRMHQASQYSMRQLEINSIVESSNSANGESSGAVTSVNAGGGGDKNDKSDKTDKMQGVGRMGGKTAASNGALPGQKKSTNGGGGGGGGKNAAGGLVMDADGGGGGAGGDGMGGMTAHGHDIDFKIFQYKRQQAELKRIQLEQDLKENHPNFDKPLFSIGRDSRFRRICRTICEARFGGGRGPTGNSSSGGGTSGSGLLKSNSATGAAAGSAGTAQAGGGAGGVGNGNGNGGGAGAGGGGGGTGGPGVSIGIGGGGSSQNKNKYKQLHKLLGMVSYLDWIMIAVTIQSCIGMMFETPRERLVNSVSLQVVEYVFVAAMSIEIGLRVCAYGLFFTPNAVIKDFGGVLDLFIFAVSALFLYMSPRHVSANSPAQLLMLLRCLRPLRIFTLVPHMRKVIYELCRGFKEILLVTVLLLALIFIFANYGVQIYGGKLARCNDVKMLDKPSCTGMYKRSLFVTKLKLKNGSSPSMWVPRVWSNPYNFNFDTIASAMIALFEVLSLEGWLEVRDVIIDRMGAVIYSLFLFVVVIC